MINAGYLTSNSETAWPFDSNAVNPALDRTVASFFADGAAILDTHEQGYEVLVSDIEVGSGVLSFKIRKQPPRHGETACVEESNDEQSRFEVSAILATGEYTVVRGGWFFFVLGFVDLVFYWGS